MMRLTEKALRARIKELEEQRAIIGAEFRALSDEATMRFEVPKKKELIGKCYKFRNSYSSPQSEEDYWWLYVKIIDVTDDGNIVVEQFERDSRGVVVFKSGEGRFSAPEDGYTIITSKEYNFARKGILKEIG